MQFVKITTPTFSSEFTTQLSVDPDILITSNRRPVSGINTPVSITIDQGSFILNNQPTATQGTLEPTNTQNIVQVVIRSSSGFNATKTAILTIGSGSQSFSVVTRAQDFTPATFSFTAQTEVATGMMITSNVATITSIDTTTAIRIDGGSYLINGVVTTVSTVSKDDEVAVQVLSSDQYNTAVTAILFVGFTRPRSNR